MAATPAFARFEQEWLDAHPEYAIASIFLPPPSAAGPMRSPASWTSSTPPRGCAIRRSPRRSCPGGVANWRPPRPGMAAIRSRRRCSPIGRSGRPGIVAGACRRHARQQGNTAARPWRTFSASGPAFIAPLHASKLPCPALSMPTSRRMRHCGQFHLLRELPRLGTATTNACRCRSTCSRATA